ncbi:hypothetical protein ABZ656_16520 [Streptomyces sp. NPDC007095]|uniref:hypothetical protein n=1 Tax=Streptomyces sp. NPDC007095 TaxID=3154482 RepID=UPI0034072580
MAVNETVIATLRPTTDLPRLAEEPAKSIKVGAAVFKAGRALDRAHKAVKDAEEDTRQTARTEKLQKLTFKAGDALVGEAEAGAGGFGQDLNLLRFQVALTAWRMRRPRHRRDRR